MTPLFSADSIGKSYRGRAVLKSASVWAYPGRVTVLFGRNGCGKSTLLKVGAGVLAADHGVVHFAGEAYLRPRLHRLARRGLFYLPDRGLLSPRLTLRQHLQALTRRFRAPRLPELLERLGLDERLDQGTHELSGGEVRRAEVAIALARQPLCLLADEPLAEVSPADAEMLAGILREAAAEGCAVVVTGHDVPQLMQAADDVVWMVAGTTHHLGTPADAGAHEQFRRDYLGPGRFPPDPAAPVARG